jgi:hypothetical protein
VAKVKRSGALLLAVFALAAASRQQHSPMREVVPAGTPAAPATSHRHHLAAVATTTNPDGARAQGRGALPISHWRAYIVVTNCMSAQGSFDRVLALPGNAAELRREI